MSERRDTPGSKTTGSIRRIGSSIFRIPPRPVTPLPVPPPRLRMKLRRKLVLAMVVAALVPVAIVAGLAAVIVLAWRRLRDGEGKELVIVRATIASLVVFMAFGKVFSPQYLLWLLPLAVPVALAEGRRSIAALAAILLVTQIIYPIGNPALQHGATWVSVLVLARNLGLVAWSVWPLAIRRRRAAP